MRDVVPHILGCHGSEAEAVEWATCSAERVFAAVGWVVMH